VKIMCWLDHEDYEYLKSVSQQKRPLEFYGYTFKVAGGSESTGVATTLRLVVVELKSANMAVGLALPEGMELEGEFELGFISQMDPDPKKDIAIRCKLSEEVKRATYMGDDTEKLEYIGFSLEKFYEGKGARFYLNDLRGSAPPEKE